MNKKTKGLLAGAAGAALLLGGGTFALWSDTEMVEAGTITAGNLAVEQFHEPIWEDISADREDSNHDIDLEDFRIIPGDTIRGQFFIDAALEGDNMVAELAVDSDFLNGNEFLDVSMRIHGPDGLPIGHRDWDGDPIEVLFASEDNSSPYDADLPTLPVDIDGNVAFHIFVHIGFDEDTSGQDHAQASVDLGEVQVSLDQVREGSPGYGG